MSDPRRSPNAGDPDGEVGIPRATPDPTHGPGIPRLTEQNRELRSDRGWGRRIRELVDQLSDDARASLRKKLPSRRCNLLLGEKWDDVARQLASVGFAGAWCRDHLQLEKPHDPLGISRQELLHPSGSGIGRSLGRGFGLEIGRLLDRGRALWIALAGGVRLGSGEKNLTVEVHLALGDRQGRGLVEGLLGTQGDSPRPQALSQLADVAPVQEPDHEECDDAAHCGQAEEDTAPRVRKGQQNRKHRQGTCHLTGTARRDIHPGLAGTLDPGR